MTMPIVAFCNFVKTHKNVRFRISKVKIPVCSVISSQFCHFLQTCLLVLEPTVILYLFVCRVLYMRIVTSDTLV
jgi:hypothetical protein